MINNNIIIAETEKIFLEFAKNLDIKNIKTSENIIIWEKERKNSEAEDENLVIIHWKDILKTVDFIKNSYILIGKIVIANKAEIIWNCELKVWDIVIPNTFISKSWETKFLDSAVWENYDLKSFWIMLSWICSEWDLKDDTFASDIKSENIFSYLTNLEKEELLEKTTVILQIWEEYKNLVTITDMTI